MNFIILIAGLLNLYLGLLVWTKGKTKKLNLFFALFGTVTFLLCLFDFIFRYLPTAEIVRWSYAFAVISPNFAILWLDELCGVAKRKIFDYLIQIPGIIFFVITLSSDLIVKKINYLTILGYRGETGKLFMLYSLYILLITTFVILKVYFNQKKLLYVKKQQLRLILMGVVMYSVSASFFSLILPSFFDIYDFTMLDAPSSLFFVGFSAYVITRYRFMGIKLIFSNIFIYVFSTFFLVITSYLAILLDTKFFGSPFTWGSFIFAFPLAFVVAFTYFRFISKVEEWSDQIFYRGLNPKKLLNDLIIKSSRMMSLEKLAEFLVKQIKRVLDAEKVAIVFFPPSSDISKKIKKIERESFEEAQKEKDLNERIVAEIGNVGKESFMELGKSSEYGKNDSTLSAGVNKDLPAEDKSIISEKVAIKNGNLDKISDNLRLYNQTDFPDLAANENQILFSFLRISQKEVSREELVRGKSGGKYSEHLSKIFEKNGINLIVPLLNRGQVIGAIIMSEKFGSGVYSAEDIEFIKIASSQIAISFMNAFLNDQIEYLNKNLEKKVKAQTQDIIKNSEQMEKLLAMRSEFLNVASHQLRTPISVIKGMMSMFHEGSVRPQDMKMFVEGTFVKSLKLADIIDDILKANEIETEGEYTLALVPTEVDPILEAVVKEKTFEANDKKVKLELELPKKKLPKVVSEAEALSRVIRTLVGNALTYTKEGEIKVTAKAEGEYVVVRVIDSGIGIPEEDIPKLFHKFSRGKNAVHAYADGSGLGLFIAKKIIESHQDADIYVEKTELGKGTTFAIKLKKE